MVIINEKPSDYFKSPLIIKSKKFLWTKTQTQARCQKTEAKSIQALYYDKQPRYRPQSTRDVLIMGRGIMNIKLKELNKEYLKPSWLSNNIK